jgi:hypothetical protein
MVDRQVEAVRLPCHRFARDRRLCNETSRGQPREGDQTSGNTTRSYQSNTV